MPAFLNGGCSEETGILAALGVARAKHDREAALQLAMILESLRRQTDAHAA